MKLTGVLIAGSVCVLMAMGIRASMGLFLQPMSLDLGWGREVFALAMIDNVENRVGMPRFEAILDRGQVGRGI